MLHLLIDTVLDDEKEWRRHHTKILVFYVFLTVIGYAYLMLSK